MNTETDTTNWGQLITLLGAIGLIVGALSPWAVITSDFLGISRTVYGHEGDGVFSGGIGLLILISILLSKGKSGKFFYSVAGAIFGILAGMLILWKIVDLGSIAIADSIRVSIGSGLYLSAGSALLAVIGGFQRAS